MNNPNESGQGTLATYSIGFGLSIFLTLAAYLIVVHHLFASHSTTVFAICLLAIFQLFVQLIFFLHLGKESKPRWNLTVLAFAAMVVIIIVFGSIWIMNNLNYNQMSPSQMDHFVHKDELNN